MAPKDFRLSSQLAASFFSATFMCILFISLCAGAPNFVEISKGTGSY